MPHEVQPDAVFSALFNHPEIGPQIQWGLNGRRFIDHLITLLENPRYESDMVVTACYITLQQTHSLHFRTTDHKMGRYYKNQGYRACNGF